MNSDNTLSRQELCAGLSLAAVFFLRMLGVFMVLPVIAMAAGQFPGVRPLTVGLALGLYGLTQALLQIPMGILSDHWGRKPVILLGLGLFVAGSLVLAWADSVAALLAGRALQGCGAIAAPLMALGADLARPEQHSRIMAFIGLGVGAAFGLSFLLGPGLYAVLGLPALLMLCAILALLAMVVLLVLTPSAQGPSHRQHRLQAQGLLGNPGLWQATLGIFLSHLLLMANFTVLPLLLRDTLGLAAGAHWRFYLPMLLLAGLGSGLLLFYCRWSRRITLLIPLCILCYLPAQLGLGLWREGLAIFLLAVLFFTAFSCLEACLPAQAASSAPVQHRGAALGVYGTAQFLGIFCGGLFGGALHDQAGQDAVFFGCALLVVLWIVLWRLLARRPALPDTG